MSGRNFNVLWDDLYTGTLAGRGLASVIFPALVALKRSDQIVPYNARSLAHLWGLPEADVQGALDNLARPDPLSRNPAEGGALIVHVPGEGYRIVSGQRDQDRFRKRAEYARQKSAKAAGGAK